MRDVELTKRCGFTLVELVLVIMILAILAGFVVPLLGGLNQISTPTGPKSDRQIVTETTMRAIRDAIMGTDTRPGAWLDVGQRPDLFPTDLSQLLADTHPTVDPFNPVSKIGWRGPYLQGSFRQDDGSFVFLDGWGNPLRIFIPDTNENSVMDRDDIQYARLVSTGENGELEILEKNTEDYIPGGSVPATALTLDECGDDLVLFFFVADTRQ